MSKFNTVDKRGPRNTGGPITSNPVAAGTTYNGAPGYEYDTLSQLFLLASSNMVGEDTFYESADKRDGRYENLIHQAVEEGHSAWLGRFLPWLRNSANMRSASIVGAIEAAHMMVNLDISGGRQIVNSVLQRADEPGEALAYYMGKSDGGRNVPKPIKRGIADAVTRLYTEYSALRYDTESKGLRFGDVLELVHATPGSFEQGDLFKWLVTRGKKRQNVEIPETLTMIRANQLLRERAAQRPELLLNTAQLRQAGMSWEAAKSLAGNRVATKDLWEMLIPTMGYMALLRNLRNFDEAGISGDLVDIVKQKLMDPVQVAKSRQLPMRFLSAYRNVPSNRWAHALDVALELCLGSIPEFKGSTLILIDTSGSMTGNMSGKSQLKLQDASALFGLALARRCESATVVSYASTFMPFPQVKGESLLRSMDRFQKGYFIGSGTSTAHAVQTYYRGQDRVIVLTDEQADMNYGVFAPVPENKVAVTFNLAGYRYGHAPAGTRTRLAVGGLSDAAWTLLHAVEARGRGQWPF
jgi:hypothetical protein